MEHAAGTIRRMISNAIAHEEQTGTLAQPVSRHARGNGLTLDGAAISQIVAFL